MSEEELQKAIEIMTQPITVSCVDYHYFDKENYDKLASALDSSLWLLKQYESILKENKQLKELKYKFFDASGDEESFTLEDYLDLSNKVYDLEQENQQLKEVIEEVREYVNTKLRDVNLTYGIDNEFREEYDDLLQILDKVK